MMVETIRKLLHREAWHNVNKIITKFYPADIAHLMRFLREEEQHLLFSRITDIEKAAETLSELEISLASEIIICLPEEQSIQILKAMSDDDKADLLAHLPEDLSHTLLEKLGTEESQEIETLLSYDDDTAGGIMTTEFFALSEDCDIAEAVEAIRRRGIWREAKIGITMGIICGLVVGIIALAWHHKAMIGLVVAIAMSASMTIAAAMGALVPTIFQRLKIDPAIASGPFVTTSNDIIGILVYMGTASISLKYFF